MKIWIVGANGLLGKTLQARCEKNKLKCVATSRAQADITDLTALKMNARLIAPTHIVNCAAYTDVDGAEKNEALAFDLNASGAENLALAAQSCGAKFVHISTNFVFDGLKSSPYLETDPCRPLAVYAKSKWEGEQRVLRVFPSACILRTSWLFGEMGFHFISRLCQLLVQNEEIRVVEDHVASPTFCPDLAEAILKLICHSGIFHFANAGVCSRYQIAQEIKRHASLKNKPMKCSRILPVPSLYFPSSAKRPEYAVLGTNKIQSLLGMPTRTWQSALREYLDGQG